MVDIQDALCTATVTHSESHRTTVKWVCSEAEHSAIDAIAKRLIRAHLEMRRSTCSD